MTKLEQTLHGRSLYEITGNVADINTLLVNRAVLREALKDVPEVCFGNMAEPASEPVAWQQELANILCRIHRDGGHYIAEYGWRKAIYDADVKVATLNAYMDTHPQSASKQDLDIAFSAGLVEGERIAIEQQPKEIPRIGCVNHDCDKCKARKQEALAEPAVPIGSLRDKVYPMAQHQEELNKFAEDSVWDGEGP